MGIEFSLARARRDVVDARTEIVAAAWRSGRLGYAALRRMLFTKPRPHGPYIVVDLSTRDAEHVLGTRCFRPNWMFSYNFRGENLNVARAFRDEQTVYRDVVWWQTHVRGWVHADGLLYLSAHHEAEPTEHPDAHTNGLGYDQPRGMQALVNALTDANVPIRAHVDRIDPSELDADSDTDEPEP